MYNGETSFTCGGFYNNFVRNETRGDFMLIVSLEF